MPRQYNINEVTGGTNMVGRAYTPQVTPNARASDDASVLNASRAARENNDGPYNRDDYDHRRYENRPDSQGRTRYDDRRRDNGADAYDRRDLQPTYGQYDPKRHSSPHRADYWRGQDTDELYGDERFERARQRDRT